MEWEMCRDRCTCCCCYVGIIIIIKVAECYE